MLHGLHLCAHSSEHHLVSSSSEEVAGTPWQSKSEERGAGIELEKPRGLAKVSAAIKKTEHVEIIKIMRKRRRFLPTN